MVPSARIGPPGTGRRTEGKGACRIRPRGVPRLSRSAPKAASCRRRWCCPTSPVSWNYDPTTFNFGNVNGGTLFLGPAERADVIVDFSQYAGQTLILYNDAPTAFPALVPQYDYYTGAPDRRDIGGARHDTAGRRSQHPDGHADQGGGSRRHCAPRLLQPGDLDRAGQRVQVARRVAGRLRAGAGADHRGADRLQFHLQQHVPRDMAELGHLEDHRQLHQLPAGGRYDREQFR